MTAQTEATTATVGSGLTATGAGLFGYAADATAGGAQSAIGSVGIWMALIGFATTAIPFITRMVESGALSLWRENRALKKRARLKRAFIIAMCNKHDEPLPAWFDEPISDDRAEPKSTDSNPPVVKLPEDTVDLPRAD